MCHDSLPRNVRIKQHVISLLAMAKDSCVPCHARQQRLYPAAPQPFSKTLFRYITRAHTVES